MWAEFDLGFLSSSVLWLSYPRMSGFEDDFGEMVEPVAIVPTLVGEVNNASASGEGEVFSSANSC